MLVAECRGKTRSEVEGDEDYLTSSIFGHLRYIPPHLFWDALFKRTKGADSCQTSLKAFLHSNGIAVDAYSSLTIEFWKYHKGFGEPDMILHFSAEGMPKLVVIIEVKLWSGKSNYGERDQLVDYLRLAETLGADHSALVYLTPSDSSAEVEETLQRLPNRGSLRPSIYRLQWQDVLSAANECATAAPEPTKTILSDVCKFLRRRGLEYFGGYQRLKDAVLPDAAAGGFYDSPDLANVMQRLSDLELWPIRRAGWIT